MPNYNAGQVLLSSGVLYSDVLTPLHRVTNVRTSAQPPRVNINVLNRGKPLEQRPVINYTPADVTVDMVQSSLRFEQMCGLVNNTGIAAALTDTAAATAQLGIRNMQILYAPTNSTNYNGELDFASGVLTSYSLQGSVTEPVRSAFSMQFLNMSGAVNTTVRDTSNYAVGPIKPENMSITGIQFTGLGITGVTIQSFSLGVTFSRAPIMALGSKFPTSRPLTDVNATLQVQGFMEGLNNSFTGLQTFDCGTPMYGTVGLTFSPSCVATSPYTITAINPYWEGLSVDSQVGNFTTISFALSFPLGPNPLETGDGSVLKLT